jgi:two-component system sensor histidine kinase FlrB
MSALVKGLPGGVLVLDTLGAILENNPAAVELLGEPLLGQSFQTVMDRAVISGGALTEHTELRSGRFVNISRRELAGGGEVVLLTDITEAHLMQVFLTRQQRLLTMGELAAGLAHQIRTPLATALLYASQMSLPDRTHEDLSRCGEKTISSLRQLDRLVNDMLAFAHGGAARELVSVSALLEQVAQWLRPALRRGIRLTIRTQAPESRPTRFRRPRRTSTWSCWRVVRTPAGRRSSSATTAPEFRPLFANASLNLFSPLELGATVSACRS